MTSFVFSALKSVVSLANCRRRELILPPECLIECIRRGEAALLRNIRNIHMLIALGTHIIRLEQVKEAAEFLIEIMPVMFIPAGVGLLTAWGILKPVCVPIIVLTVITTVVVMVVTGRVTQTVIRMDRKKGQKRS